MKAKLGMSPIAWWNGDLAELSDDVSLEECLRQSRSAGFTGMEQGRRFENNPEEMLPILKAADVTLCGGWFSGTLTIEDLASNKAHPADDRIVQGGQRAVHCIWRSWPLNPGRPVEATGRQSRSFRR